MSPIITDMTTKIKLSNKIAHLASLPREKLLAKGSKHLTDAELVAILLGTGCPKNNVLTLSDNLLRRIPLKKLSSVPVTELTMFPGVGSFKAVRILAALELGERIYGTSHLGQVTIQTTQDVIDEVKEFAVKKQEHLIALYLNSRFELLAKEVIGMGSLNNLVITPKEVFSHALSLPCTSIVVVHNHPSGDPTPSDDDIRFTNRIHQAGEVMGIKLFDHIILAKTSYFSFRDNRVGR